MEVGYEDGHSFLMKKIMLRYLNDNNCMEAWRNCSYLVRWIHSDGYLHCLFTLTVNFSNGLLCDCSADQLILTENVHLTNVFNPVSSGRVRGGGGKHEIYAAAFVSHLSYD